MSSKRRRQRGTPRLICCFLLFHALGGGPSLAQTEGAVGDARQKLAGLLHAWRLDGDFAKVKNGLAALVARDEAPDIIRAMAALKLA